MKTRDFPDGTILLKAEPGDEIISAVTAEVQRRGIFAGGLAAIGACSEAEIGFWDGDKREYVKETIRGPLEILALTGNVAKVEDGKAFIHAHAVVGDRKLNTRGGHLFRAVAEPTCEIILRPLAGALERRMEECGLRLWKL